MASMNSLPLDDYIRVFAVNALPVLFAITLHEAAHGYAARHYGDNTAWQAGRISLNPLRHIDLWGTILLPTMILLLSGSKFLFGYAKPVPVNFGQLRNPKRDMLWVAAAGPAMNLLMAVGWALLFKYLYGTTGTSLAHSADSFASTEFLLQMSQAGISINIVLLVLNLIPLPPLDGGRIAVSLLPHKQAWQFSRIEPYGFVILLVLLFTGILGRLMLPAIDLVTHIIFSLLNF